MLRPYVLRGHNVDSCRRAGPSSNGRTPDFGSGYGGSNPPGPIPFSAPPFTRSRCTDGFSSDPDDGPPGGPDTRGGCPDAADGVPRPPRLRGWPASPLPGVRPLHLHAITALARNSLLARRR